MSLCQLFRWSLQAATRCCAATILIASAFGAEEVDFTRDIRPILSNHCFQCHGPDDDSREADLRLDSLKEATTEHDGHAAIVVGDAAQSNVIHRVKSDDADLKMPPEEFGKPLTNTQVDL